MQVEMSLNPKPCNSIFNRLGQKELVEELIQNKTRVQENVDAEVKGKKRKRGKKEKGKSEPAQGEYSRGRLNPVSNLFQHFTDKNLKAMHHYIRTNSHPPNGKYMTIEMFIDFLRGEESICHKINQYLPPSRKNKPLPTRKQASMLLDLLGYEYAKTEPDTYAKRAKKPETKAHRQLAIPLFEYVDQSEYFAVADHDETQARVWAYPAMAHIPKITEGEKLIKPLNEVNREKIGMSAADEECRRDSNKRHNVGVGLAIGAFVDTTSKCLLTENQQVAGHARPTTQKYTKERKKTKREREEEEKEKLENEEKDKDFKVGSKKKKQTQMKRAKEHVEEEHEYGAKIVKGGKGAKRLKAMIAEGPSNERGNDSNATFLHDLNQGYIALKANHPGRIPVIFVDGAGTHTALGSQKNLSQLKKKERIEYLKENGGWTEKLESCKKLTNEVLQQAINELPTHQKPLNPAEELAVSHGGVLIFLMNAHPELNPMEQIWRNLKETRKHNGGVRSLDELSQHVVEKFDKNGSSPIETSSIRKYIYTAEQLRRFAFRENPDRLPKESKVEKKNWKFQPPLLDEVADLKKKLGLSKRGGQDIVDVEEISMRVQAYAHHLNSARIYKSQKPLNEIKFDLEASIERMKMIRKQLQNKQKDKKTADKEQSKTQKESKPSKNLKELEAEQEKEQEDEEEQDIANVLTNIRKRKDQRKMNTQIAKEPTSKGKKREERTSSGLAKKVEEQKPEKRRKMELSEQNQINKQDQKQTDSKNKERKEEEQRKPEKRRKKEVIEGKQSKQEEEEKQGEELALLLTLEALKNENEYEKIVKFVDSFKGAVTGKASEIFEEAKSLICSDTLLASATTKPAAKKNFLNTFKQQEKIEQEVDHLSRAGYPQAALELVKYGLQKYPKSKGLLSQQKKLLICVSKQELEDVNLDPDVEKLVSNDLVSSLNIGAYLTLLRQSSKKSFEVDSAFTVSSYLQQMNNLVANASLTRKLKLYLQKESTVLLPFCDEHHFCLAVLSTSQATITRYDSIAKYNKFNEMVETLAGVLSRLSRKQYQVVQEKVPQQPDGINCGIHTMVAARNVFMDTTYEYYGLSFNKAKNSLNVMQKIRKHIQDELREKKLIAFEK